MRILLFSHRFAPDIGGIESISALLVRRWRTEGHHVVVVTSTAGEDLPGVMRNPSWFKLLPLVFWADVVYHNHINFRHLWPLLLFARPWINVTQTWLGGTPERNHQWVRRKRRVLGFAHNLYISRAIARHVGHRGWVVGNPYDETRFRSSPSGPSRSGELLFVGRLVSDKGVDLLLAALGKLSPDRKHRLSIVGEGPEESNLIELARSHGLQQQVEFLGAKSAAGVANLMKSHRVLVMPSRWPEPFGITALEGLACGCVVIASDRGGLPEALGPATESRLFPNGDIAALQELLEAHSEDNPENDPPSPALQQHLQRHSSRERALLHLDLMLFLTGQKPEFVV